MINYVNKVMSDLINPFRVNKNLSCARGRIHVNVFYEVLQLTTTLGSTQNRALSFPA